MPRAKRPPITKKALLLALDRDTLRAVIAAVGLTGVDRRSPSAMRNALGAHRDATTRRMLDALDGDVLLEVLDRAGFESDGQRAQPPAPRSTSPRRSRFVAIDFETADYGADSACAVALVRVDDGRIVDRAYRLIRPPRRQFVFTYIHNITWGDVATEPAFGEVWPQLTPLLDGADFIVAHNASFDRNVMAACCAASGLPMPRLPFKCTVKWSRRTFDLPRANLPTVCEHLGIPLDHHNAMSDAEACARIMIEVQQRWRQAHGAAVRTR